MLTQITDFSDSPSFNNAKPIALIWMNWVNVGISINVVNLAYSQVMLHIGAAQIVPPIRFFSRRMDSISTEPAWTTPFTLIL